ISFCDLFHGRTAVWHRAPVRRVAVATTMALSKASLEGLAVLGGPALFADELHVGRPNIGDRQRLMASIEAMPDRRWLTNDGPLVAAFEAAVAARHAVRHCVATNNATAGLQIAIRASGMRGEVILPSFT